MFMRTALPSVDHAVDADDPDEVDNIRVPARHRRRENQWHGCPAAPSAMEIVIAALALAVLVTLLKPYWAGAPAATPAAPLPSDEALAIVRDLYEQRGGRRGRLEQLLERVFFDGAPHAI